VSAISAFRVSETGQIQPPCAKPPVVSSSGPPGACTTPSSEMNALPMTLRIARLLRSGRLDPGDADHPGRRHCFVPPCFSPGASKKPGGARVDLVFGSNS
jgi:hypothetical protein